MAAALRYGDDAGFDERVAFLTERLAAMDQAKEWKHAVKQELARPEYPADQVLSVRPTTSLDNPLLSCLLEKMGLVSSIKHAVIELHCDAMQSAAAASKKQPKQPDDFRPLPDMRGCSLDAVRAARDNWEKITRDEMLRLAQEQGRPLVAQTATVPSVEPEAAARGDGQSTATPTPEADGAKPSKPAKTLATRFLYDGYASIVHIFLLAIVFGYGSLYSPPFPEYRRLFSELAPSCGQIGLDELFPAQRQAFLAEKNRVGDLVLAHQSVSMARQYSKTGCPISLRPQEQAAKWTYLTDDMYLLDLQQTTDSSDYFVFQDHLESVLMAFTRDTYVRDHALQVNGTVNWSPASGAAAPSTTPASEVRSAESAAATTDQSVPPNGVLPFSGLVMYVAPLAYLYTDPVDIYYVFRELYVRYWSKLNAIRIERGTILPLCKLFEELVVRSSPAAVFHLLNIGLKPLDIAFPWIQSAFSGVLDIEQVLLLWDRVVGYDSLELVAIFAAALFHFRANELERVTSREEADDLFAELIDIPVVTLLQGYLFGLQ
ncbi:hypothetical protein BBJ28_00015186 [Nothophytophthora sp. Chile5]|nr:hypothetical protein BBJ28_00015186 [Nothophytophthora sp. Chile5]